MSQSPHIGTLLWTLHLLLQLAFIARVLLRPYREPTSRVAWVAVIILFPILGLLAYMLLGEKNIAYDRIERIRQVLARLPDPATIGGTGVMNEPRDTAHPYLQLIEAGKTVNGFVPTCGNQAELLDDTNSVIDRLVADIEAAQEHVHLLFYIWLPDRNGHRVAEALQRAATRGVTCRAMADSLGSRIMIESAIWRTMAESGVHVAEALPFSLSPLRPRKARIDLRNHRKIVVIDNRITYCGSQNCADPEFRIKAKYGPWVDIAIRLEGPVASQNQYLFAGDWMNEVDEDICYLMKQQPAPKAGCGDGVTVQVIGTGPTMGYSAMPEMFESLMYAARRELIISTPYFVPDEPMLAALCACPHRGVETTIILPARNDSHFVSAASKSYYGYLLDAGVRIFEYQGGLLHAKSLTLDGEIALIGSANMDRRSFELNYENNILVHDRQLTAEIRIRQQSYIASSVAVSKESVEQWSWGRRLWINGIATLGPVL